MDLVAFFSFLSGDCWGAVCRASARPGFRCVLFLSTNHDEDQNIKLNKNSSTLRFCIKSL